MRVFRGLCLLFLASCLLPACDGDDEAPSSATATATPPPTLTATPPLTSTPQLTATPTQTATPTHAGPLVIAYDFRDGSLGWQAGFADYPPGNEESFEFDAGIQQLPAELGAGTGFLLQSHNRSDDVFMFLKRRLGPEDGLSASTAYELSFTLVFGSNAQSNCAGIGGAPGESVTLKAGAAAVEPMAVLQTDGSLRLNVDKGEQSVGGSAASVAGDIANGMECGTEPVVYVSLERAHTHTAAVSTAADGSLWLLVGTDSGYEGLTAIYYQRIEVRLEESKHG